MNRCVNRRRRHKSSMEIAFSVTAASAAQAGRAAAADLPAMAGASGHGMEYAIPGACATCAWTRRWGHPGEPVQLQEAST